MAPRDEQITVLFDELRRLREESSIQGIRVQHTEAISALSDLQSELLDDIVRHDDGPGYLEALVQAISKGALLLGQQTWELKAVLQHMAALETLDWLCLAFNVSIGKFYPGFLGLMSVQQWHETTIRAATAARKSELGSACQQLCDALNSGIQSLAASRAAAAAVKKGNNLAANVLAMLGSVGQVWPEERPMLDPAVVPAMPAAARLAVTILRQPPTLLSNGSGRNSSGRNGNSVAVSGPWPLAFQLLVSFAARDTALASNLTFLQQVPAEVACCSSVQELLLMMLALAAKGMHQQQHGLSPVLDPAAAGQAAAGRQQKPRQAHLAMPPFHKQLLQALGIPAAAEFNAECVREANMWFATYITMLQRQDSWAAFQLIASSSGSSSTSAGLLPQLLLVLLEWLVLQPTLTKASAVLETFSELFTGPSRQLQLGQHEQRLAHELLPAMLNLLAPAVRHVQQEQAAAPEAAKLWKSLASTVAAIANTALDMPDMRLPFDILGQQELAWRASLPDKLLPCAQQLSPLLEALVRDTKSPALEDSTTPEVAQMAADIFVSAAAGRPGSSTGSRNGSGQQHMLLQPPMFSLLLSCIKQQGQGKGDSSSSSRCQAAAIQSIDDVREFCATLLNPARCVAEGAACLATSITSSAGGSGGSGSTAKDASSHLRLALLLLGRCLVSAGRDLQQQHAAAVSSSGGAADMDFNFNLLKTLDVCSTAVAAFTPPVLVAAGAAAAKGEKAATAKGQEAAAAAAAPAALALVERLLDDKPQLLRQLLNARSKLSAAATRSFLQSEAASQLAAGLQAFGAAACALLPSKLCCNHHGCNNLARDTERELVGGKGCVCSGCGVARYCSRDCQQAHYKQWHRAVCKRIKQQRQQA